jgi:hypothetical protein
MRPLLVLALATACTLLAHVGSPDIFFEGAAGPYRLAVSIRPPQVIPGVAEIEVRSEAPDVAQVHIVPTPLRGPGAKLAPTPDLARRSKDDPQFFTGTLWIMQTGSWQVRVRADGPRGSGELAVPVPAASARVLTMQKTLAIILLPLMALLAIGVISIVGAGIREGQLEPGSVPNLKRLRGARIGMAVAALVVAAAIWLGNMWWDSEAGWYRRYVYKPLQLAASTESGDRLALRLTDPGWFNRKLDDFIPDHDHQMHLYVIRLPEMEQVWHLHPEQGEPGLFTQQLPPMPAGRYKLFGDLVHQSGLPETVTTEVQLPQIAGRPVAGDDTAGSGPPLSQVDYARTDSPLADGGRMVWVDARANFETKRLHWFRFRIDDASGKPAQDLEMYMGMPGHAAFVRSDLSVFAHVHPSGSVPMAALALIERPGATPSMAGMHAMHSMNGGSLPAVVSFPYGFPQPGAYRIFVQIKRAGRVQTGVFDVKVEK